MNEFFTWTTLATSAGATLATTMFTQLFKGVGFLKNVPTRAFSYVVALIILLGASFFTTTLTAGVVGLCVVNAGVVSLAANGAYDAINGKKSE